MLHDFLIVAKKLLCRIRGHQYETILGGIKRCSICRRYKYRRTRKQKRSKQ
jgi:hypothetical protein